jgi:hypothetical protein
MFMVKNPEWRVGGDAWMVGQVVSGPAITMPTLSEVGRAQRAAREMGRNTAP